MVHNIRSYVATLKQISAMFLYILHGTISELAVIRTSYTEGEWERKRETERKPEGEKNQQKTGRDKGKGV